MGKLYHILRKDDPELGGTFECKCGNKIPVPSQPEDGDYVCCFGCGGHFQYQVGNTWVEQEDLFGE